MAIERALPLGTNNSSAGTNGSSAGTEVNTFDQLQALYNDGSSKTKQGQELTATQAADIIANIGVDFGTYSDALKNTITGMTRIEAFSYLFNLIGSIDAHDGGSDDNTDFKIEGKLDIDSIFKDIGLGSNQSQINNSLTSLGTKIYKDANGIDATDQELMDTFKYIQDPKNANTPPELTNKAWVGMLQLQDAFGNNTDVLDAQGNPGSNGVADDLEDYNRKNGTNLTEERYQAYLDTLENGQTPTETNTGKIDTGKTYKIKNTNLKITQSALDALNAEFKKAGITQQSEFKKILDFDGNGKFDVNDLIAIASLNTGKPNDDDSTITADELTQAFMRSTRMPLAVGIPVPNNLLPTGRYVQTTDDLPSDWKTNPKYISDLANPHYDENRNRYVTTSDWPSDWKTNPKYSKYWSVHGNDPDHMPTSRYVAANY